MSLRSDWYQLSKETVVLVLYGKDLKEKGLSINVESTQICIQNADKSLAFHSALSHPVVPESTTVKYTAPKVEITLYKADPSINWTHLAPTIAHSEPLPNINSQNKWSKALAKEDEEEKSSEGVESFFRSIYAGSDEDSRKAMIKSFTESGGTCLSTNWNEVQKKKVEYVPSTAKEQEKTNK